MKKLIKEVFFWYFRRKSPALYIVNAGISLCLMAAVGWVLSITIPSEHGDFHISINGDGNAPVFITQVLFWLGILLVVLGTVWEAIRYRQNRLELSKKKTIVIEVRGLRDAVGASLLEAVPSSFKGQKNGVLVDLRQKVDDGVIVDPISALSRLTTITHQIAQLESGLDRSDISTVYGGLAPVPYTFLTGVIIDDESEINIFDWDRNKGKWRSLEEEDDNKRFASEHIGRSLTHGASEAILAVSVSYKVNLNSIQEQFGEIPITHLELEDGSPDSHWSEEKQIELGKQFLTSLIDIESYGVKRIHLFIAAPNSLVFRFGRLYDKRNLPEVTVYQYQRELTPTYPWGILMPVSGISVPSLVR